MNNMVAIKSGYYFDIFSKYCLPEHTELSGIKVELDGKIYDLYRATRLSAEKEIDKLFDKYNKGMGYEIDSHLYKSDWKICSICGKPFTEWGNNAQPVNDGTCCNKCNREIVVPRRLQDILTKNTIIKKEDMPYDTEE